MEPRLKVENFIPFYGVYKYALRCDETNPDDGWKRGTGLVVYSFAGTSLLVMGIIK